MKTQNHETKPKRRKLLDFALLEFAVAVVTLTLVLATGLGAYVAFSVTVVVASVVALASVVVFRSGIEKQTSPLLMMTVIVLAAVASVASGQALSLGNQVSTLKASGRSFCSSVQQSYSFILDLLSNTTQILHQQIINDTSLIAILNSTKPAGYEEMVVTLTNQISQDRSLIGTMNDAAGANAEAVRVNPFCVSVVQ